MAIRGYDVQGKMVCHHCDNPSCVNSDHLFADTRAGNNRDRHRKGRTARGEDHGNAKLTREEIVRMRQDRATGKYTVFELADRYGCSQPQVTQITTGRQWKHVEGPITNSRVIRDHEVPELRRRYWWSGESKDDLAEAFGISMSYIEKIIYGYRKVQQEGPTSSERPPMPPPRVQRKIRVAVQGGTSIDAVVSEHNLPRSMVLTILNRDSSPDRKKECTDES